AKYFPMVVCVLSLLGANMLNYRNANFHTELKMLRAMEEARWDEVLELMNKKRPTRQMVLMKDVALAQQGKLGEKAFDFPIGGIRPQMNTDLPIHMAHSAAPYFYYWLGIPNFAFVWCQEDVIEYGLSPYFLKLMHRSMLAIGDEVTAERYLKLLRRNPFYADYKVDLTETDAVRRFMTGHDLLTNDRGFCETFLLDVLSQEQYETPEAQQIAVHWAILSRNRKRYEKAVQHYIRLTDKQSALPRYMNAQAFEWYYNQDTGKRTY
ncbi:MAG: DUF6057 family protein, partial [Bacteroidales bacterium]|nr:DUF6057 family protein [Bacteroidales bacterium]